MAVRVQSLPCPNCGASLRWNGEARVVECRYCQTHVAVDTGNETSLPSEVVSRARVPRGAVIGAACVLGLLVVGGSLIAMQRGKAGRGPAKPAPVRTSTAAELMSTSLALAPLDFAARHGVNAGERSVSVVLSDSPYERAIVSWYEDAPDHVGSIQLMPRDAAVTREDAARRARDLLGRRLRDTGTSGYQFSGGGLSLVIDTTLYASANIRDQPTWKEQLVALWAVARHAAFGEEVELSQRQRRELLSLGYPLAVVGDIGFDVPLEEAADTVARVAPGTSGDRTSFSIDLDHPWFESASLGWENKARGAWSNLTLYYPIETSLPDIVEPLTACLRPLLGEPKKIEQDHAAGTYWLQYEGRKGNPWVDAGMQTFQVYLRYTFGDPATAAGFSALIATLAACPPAR